MQIIYWYNLKNRLHYIHNQLNHLPPCWNTAGEGREDCTPWQQVSFHIIWLAYLMGSPCENILPYKTGKINLWHLMLVVRPRGRKIAWTRPKIKTHGVGMGKISLKPLARLQAIRARKPQTVSSRRKVWEGQNQSSMDRGRIPRGKEEICINSKPTRKQKPWKSLSSL